MKNKLLSGLALISPISIIIYLKTKNPNVLIFLVFLGFISFFFEDKIKNSNNYKNHNEISLRVNDVLFSLALRLIMLNLILVILVFSKFSIEVGYTFLIASFSLVYATLLILKPILIIRLMENDKMKIK